MHSDGIPWLLLAVAGCCWLLHAGCCWLLLVAVVVCWLLYSCWWLLLVVAGCCIVVGWLSCCWLVGCCSCWLVVVLLVATGGGTQTRELELLARRASCAAISRLGAHKM